MQLFYCVYCLGEQAVQPVNWVVATRGQVNNGESAQVALSIGLQLLYCLNRVTGQILTGSRICRIHLAS
jgi:hypothetical protein